MVRGGQPGVELGACGLCAAVGIGAGLFSVVLALKNELDIHTASQPVPLWFAPKLLLRQIAACSS